VEFTYQPLPGRVVFGAGTSRTRLAAEVQRLGAGRVLLVVAPQERELADELVAPLGDAVVGTFTEVRPHVPIEVAQAARAMAREVAADGLLAVGGGSTTGAAKAVALELGLPIAAVPTTYAGSEMTPIYGLTTGQRKQTGSSLDVLPKLVVYDPELTVSLPPHITGPSAMNAMAHCVEALYAPGANPVTSLLAEEGIRALADGMPRAVADPGDIAARSTALYGAYLAASALAVAGTGLHHKICHVLGGAYDLPHAEMHAILLPHVVAQQERVMPAVMDRVARALGVTRPAEGLYALERAAGIPTALTDVGMREADVDEAVGLVLEAVPSNNGHPLEEQVVRTILADAVAGRSPAHVDHLTRERT
jgi:maleylacetate reductase